MAYTNKRRRKRESLDERFDRIRREKREQRVALETMRGRTARDVEQMRGGTARGVAGIRGRTARDVAMIGGISGVSRQALAGEGALRVARQSGQYGVLQEQIARGAAGKRAELQYGAGAPAQKTGRILAEAALIRARRSGKAGQVKEFEYEGEGPMARVRRETTRPLTAMRGMEGTRGGAGIRLNYSDKELSSMSGKDLLALRSRLQGLQGGGGRRPITRGLPAPTGPGPGGGAPVSPGGIGGATVNRLGRGLTPPSRVSVSSRPTTSAAGIAAGGKQTGVGRARRLGGRIRPRTLAEKVGRGVRWRLRAGGLGSPLR